VDVGTVRVGIAISDPDGILATPLVTLARDQSARAEAVPADVTEIGRLVRDHEVIQVVVGLPVTLSGNEGLAAIAARHYADTVAKQVDPVPVQLADERMSTVIATRRLSERGVRRRRQRAVVDQAAAVEILQGWLDARRS
jgi:putative Holliday junction resolvase